MGARWLTFGFGEVMLLDDHPSSTNRVSLLGTQNMAIVIPCPCGRSLRVKDEFAGRKVRCPGCTNVLSVPQALQEKDAEHEALDYLLTDSPPEPPKRPNTREAVATPEEVMRRPSVPPRYAPPTPAASVKSRGPAQIKKRRRSGPLLVVHREIVAGVLMILGAIVWFGLGLAAGIIFIYPPILLVLGIGAVIRGYASSL
jgi:hypothetical protein